MVKRKEEKRLKGSLFQRGKNGLWYYRLTVARRLSKQIPMKTSDYERALEQARYYDSLLEVRRAEDAAARFCEYKGLLKRKSSLSLTVLWDMYEKSPNRDHAGKHTHDGYRATMTEFVMFAQKNCNSLDDITFEVAQQFSEYLKTTGLSVYTHNRKIKRLKKIFGCFRDYYLGENPFQSPVLLRKDREERDHAEPRRAFTRNQIQRIKEVLDDPSFKMKNKAEIKVIYYLGMCTGLRLKDCVLLKWAEVDMTRKHLSLLQHKTNRLVQIPIADVLYDILLEAKNWRRDSYVCPNCAERYQREDKHGKNIGSNLLDHDVLKVIRQIGLEPSMEVKGRKKRTNVYGFHSLRHTFCSLAAESPDVTREAIRSIIGDSEKIIDKYYTHSSTASQKKAIEAVISITDGVQTSLDMRMEQIMAVIESAPDSPITQRIKSILTLDPSSQVFSQT